MELKAGRELDALVAEKVMGWVWKTFGSQRILTGPKGESFGLDHPKATLYSTDISAAWEVVEKMKRLPGKLYDHDYIQLNWRDNIWTVGWVDNHESLRDCITASTAPLAICLAALMAVGAI